MKSFLLFTKTGPMLILTNFESISDPALLDKLHVYGKFVAAEVPMEVIQSCYAAHYDHVLKDPNENPDLIVFDGDADRIFTNINFKVLSPPVYYEPEEGNRCFPILAGPGM